MTVSPYLAAALVLGIPGRIYVITTAIWDSTLAYPPDYGRASAMGLSLFVVMFGMMMFVSKMSVSAAAKPAGNTHW